MERSLRSTSSRRHFSRQKCLVYLKANWQLYIILVFVMAYFVIFHYFPMYGLRMAFLDYNPILGFEKSKFVGLAQFRRLFTGPYFWPTLKNTLVLSLYTLAVTTPIPIVIALLMNTLRNEGAKKVFQTVTYAPHFISMVVLVGMLKLFLSPSVGIVNHLIQLAGFEKVNFFGRADMFPHIYAWSDVWQNTGWNTVIYIAALAGIDPELHEAAVMDGASRWKRLLHVDIPGILPTIVILMIMSVGSIINVGFEKVYLMQNDLNISTSEVISTYAYRVGIQRAEYSFSSAVSFFNSVVTLVLLINVNYISRRISGTSLW